MRYVLIAIGTVVTVTTALPFIPTGIWLVRIFDFPRLQIAVVGLATLAGCVFFRSGDWREYIFAALLFSCVVYQGYKIFPYTPLASPQVQRSASADPESSISLLFTNVLIENREAQKVLDVVRAANPDVILAVETDEWWMEQLAELEKTHPYKVLQPQPNGYGMLFYSRLEILNEQVKYLIENDVPSIHAQVRLRSGDIVALRCLHPRPPFPTEDDSSKPRDAELLVVGRETKELSEPVVVLGDLNDVSWSHTNELFQKTSGLLDPRVGRGMYNTFHADYPFMRFPLDHFFHSTHFRLIDLRRLDHVGSDHFPVYIKLSLEPGAEQQQREPTSNESDKKDAEKKISEGRSESGH